jgi:hypothetical protein
MNRFRGRKTKFLPLSKNIKTLAVIGPNADNWEALAGKLQRDSKKSGHCSRRIEK